MYENEDLRILVKWVYEQNQVITMREFVNPNISRSVMIDIDKNVYWCKRPKEYIFAAELCVVQRNCDSLPKLSCLLRVSICCQNYGASSETFSLPNWQPAANQFSLPISTISLLGRNYLNATNNFMVWWCKMWNTWMWTYELLK